MNKKLKILFISLVSALCLTLGLAFTNTVVGHADSVTNQTEEISNSLGVSTSFDLSQLKSGVTKDVVNSKGQVTHISVEPEKTSLLGVSNGSHKVSAWGLGWSVSFYVNVSNNNITSAHDLNYTIIGASVTSASVSRDNNKQATARFTFSTPIWDILSWTGWVRANISGSSLVVHTN